MWIKAVGLCEHIIFGMDLVKAGIACSSVPSSTTLGGERG